MAKNRKQGKRKPTAPGQPPRPAANTVPRPTDKAISPRWSHALPMATLLLLIIAAFWPALFGGFVWDDNRYIVEEDQVRLVGGLADIWFMPSSLAENHYWPVLYTSFWLEHKLWGFNPFGYRLVNILLHCLNTLLLWRLLVRYAVPGAWLGAALFAVHPVHAEVVAWIITRKDLLATLFCLLAVICWQRYRQRPKPTTYLALLLLFVAASFSKTVAVTLPALLLLLAWWQQGRIYGKDWRQIAPLFFARHCYHRL